MATKKITDLTQLTDLDATDSFVVNDSGAGADKRVEFSDLQSEVLNGAAIGTSTAITELQVDNLNLNGNTFSSTDTNGNILIQPNGTGDTIINESGADSDFRVEGLSDTDLLFVDASTDRVGISTNAPASTLDVAGDLTIADKIIHSGDTNTAIRFPSADTVTVETAGSERLRIDSSGKVGIGTSSPVNRLDVLTTSTSNDAYNPAISVGVLSVAGFGGVIGSRTISGNTLQGVYIHSENSTTVSAGQSLLFNVGTLPATATDASTEKLRITSTGYIRMASGTGGIQFGGDTAAANALDDYEEGTWTPTYTTTGTDYTSVTYNSITSGRYTKIGNKVFIEAILRTDAITVGSASGTAAIAGLPFSTTSATPRAIYHIGVSDDFAGDVPSSGRSGGSSTLINLFYRTSANGTTITLNYDDLDTGSNKNDIFISGYYTV